MRSHTSAVRRRLGLFAALLGLAILAVPASALATSNDGGLEWTQYGQWVSYLTGPPPAGASGNVTVSGGATISGGVVRFVHTGGTYDTATGVGTITFTGGLKYESIPHNIDIEYTDPYIDVPISGLPTLHADVSIGGGTPTATDVLELGTPIGGFWNDVDWDGDASPEDHWLIAPGTFTTNGVVPYAAPPGAPPGSGYVAGDPFGHVTYWSED